MTHDSPPCYVCPQEARHVGYFQRTVHPSMPRWQWWAMQFSVAAGALSFVLERIA